MKKIKVFVKKLGLLAKSVESSPQNMEKQSTLGSSLHSDIITEILLRLPAKSVGRFRCVSKLWLSVTTNPSFIKSFGTTRPSLLLCSIQGHDMFVTHQSTIRSYSSSQPFHHYPMKVPGEHSYFSHMDSVQGLICIVDEDSLKPLVWNPTMGQLFVLPKPKLSSRHMNVFLGYDPVEGKHKVVCLPQEKTCYVCRVFTLGSGQESWRTVKTNFEHIVALASGRCIKGVIYYLALKSQGHDTVVMSFDVRSEIFHMIEPPSSIHWDVLITYEGRLACIDAANNKRLWSLEDADKLEWTFQDFLSPLYKMYELQGSTHAGEFIYIPFLKSSYIELYDPVGNSWRRHEFDGLISENEFGHTKAFTNHIESLIPL